MRPLGNWFTGLPGAWRSYGVGASAILLGAGLSTIVYIEHRFILSVSGLLTMLYLALVPGGPLVVVGICAIMRPSKRLRALGALVGALSAPLFIPLLSMMHPNDAGVDFGRAGVAFLLVFAVPVNMLVCAALAERLYRPWWIEEDLSGQPPRTISSVYWLARSLGFVVAIVGFLILWQANREASPEPEIALWEFVHHGILPAVPIIALGVITAILPSRLPIMCGALIGLFPALACSSLLVDLNSDNHGQTIPALVAYSLPLTLPFTVGLGGLLGNYLHRQLARSLSPSNSP